MSTLRRVVDIFGRVLIGLGVLLLLFTAYQIWGTSVQEAHTQSGLRTQLAAGDQQRRRPQRPRAGVRARQAADRTARGRARHRPPRPRATRSATSGSRSSASTRSWSRAPTRPTSARARATTPARRCPGQAGNAAIAGHRTTYGHPFYNLDSVKVGDPIVLTTLQGIFVYDTTKSFVVSPSDTTVVDNVFANQLTLTTCNPRFSATTRLVVQAKLAHSQLFPNSGLPAPSKLPRDDPKSQSLAGDSDVALTARVLLGLR